MTKIFTQNDVLRYLYNETSHDENEAIEGFMSIDSNLRDFYYEMQEVKQELDNIDIIVPERIINSILSYSRSKYSQIQQD